MSRFEKYAPESDFPPLRKLEPGESFTAELLGFHEIESQFEKVPSPVLELRDFHGQEFAFVCGGWSAREELVFADPQDGDTIKVSRRPDRGRSYQFRIEVVERAIPESDVPIDTAGLVNPGSSGEGAA